jgi:[ribosomal protein S5]-alanine N-acetyltransferase
VSVAFSTERLDAEPLAPAAHEQELARLHDDPRVMATVGGSTATPKESRAWIERNLRHGREPGLAIFVLRERASGAFGGRGAIRRIEIGGADEVEVGYAVAAERRGLGLATERAQVLYRRSAAS